jgi:hypothetical protein
MTRTLAALLCLAAVGCGGRDRPPAYATVSGTVTLDGKPMPDGKIIFTTDGRPPTILDVVDGKYTGQAMTGTNKIQITRMRPASSVSQRLPPEAQTRIRAREGNHDPLEETIPAEWNSKSTQTRVIEPGAPNVLDFIVKTTK